MRHVKKRQFDSIVFDDSARLEFLTGFRKRKLQKKEAAKSKAKERERQERLQTRKEQRQALKERAEENARLVEGALQQEDVSDVEPDEGSVTISSPPGKGKGKATQEFEDEQQLATVTIVEEFDVENLRIAEPMDPVDSEVESPTRESSQSVAEKTSVGHRSTHNSPAPPRGKIYPKKASYETKAARKTARIKRRAWKLEKVDCAATRRGRRKGGKKVRKVNR